MGTTNYSDLVQTITAAGIEKTQGRRTWADGGFTDFVTLRFAPDKLTLGDIEQTEARPKIHALSYLRYVKALSFGRENPRIITWLRLVPDRPVARLFPTLNTETDDGETLLSANSFITYTLRTLLHRGWLRYSDGYWLARVPKSQPLWRQRATFILTFLRGVNGLHLYTGPGNPLPAADDLKGIHPLQDLIPLDRLGYVREIVWRENPLAAFNTAYFLLEHNDFLSHHSGLGEAYNLFVSDGVIRRPPLYRRSALWQGADGRWALDLFGLDDMALAFPGDSHDPLTFTLNRPAPITAYTRRWAIAEQGQVVGATPIAPERMEFTIIDRRVVGSKPGGGLEIPQNGFVLSFDPTALAPGLRAALEAGRVGYQFRSPAFSQMRQAIQVGPRLLRDGEIALGPTSLADEEFWMDRVLADGARQTGVVPSDYPDDVDRTRAGRVGLGITPDGDLMVSVMMGSETKGVKNPALDSAGATLVELAALMGQHGAHDALNLDGGGSSQLFFLGGSTTVPGNRLGLQAVHYERMVPAIGVVG